MQRLLLICLLVFGVLLLPLSAVAGGQARVGIVVNFAPPELPVYDQPLCPGDGYIWTPGYWDWDGDDYYWVPGTWVVAPEVGFLWTPGYWGWGGEGFVFYQGYWGPVVGFYGGINYGYGYFGRGYEGGRWDRDHFYYNRSVNNINVTQIHNVYNTTVVNNTTNVTRVSYNGGNGGITARPTREEQAAAQQRHFSATPAQSQQMSQARSNPQLRASANHGKPPIAATPKGGALNDRAAVPAREGGRYMPPPENHATPPRNDTANSRSTTIVHPNDIRTERPTAPNTGNPKQDQKYQQQQEKLYQQQENERQKLQKQQDTEHQKLEKQQADQARQQQTEQKHQQQTEKLVQKQAQQQQHLQTHQAPPPAAHPAPSHPSQEPAHPPHE